MLKITSLIIMSLLVVGCGTESEHINTVNPSNLPVGSTNVNWVKHPNSSYSQGYGWLTFKYEGGCFLYLKAGRASVLSQHKCKQ